MPNSPLGAGDIEGTYEATEMPNRPRGARDIQVSCDEANGMPNSPIGAVPKVDWDFWSVSY